MQTIPSILEKTPQDLFYQINRISPYFPRFQIDIADGILVPNRIVQVEDIGRFFQSDDFKKYITPETLKTLSFDFHLMVKDYIGDIKKIEKLSKTINVKYVFIHYSAIDNWQSDLASLSKFPVGVTLNPQETVAELAGRYSLNKIPFIQIMSVVPGYQGSPFVPDVLNKVEQLRELGYGMEIFLDGAVNGETLPRILEKKFRPDFICPGSYLTKANNLDERANYLKKL